MSETDRLTGLVGYSGVKVPVRAASTAALTLSGEQTVDGVALVTGDRVLVKDQASSIDNGIYVVDTGAWERAKDADGPYDFIQGSLVPVYSGTTNGSTLFQQTTADPVPDTTNLTFSSYLTLIGTPLAVAQGGTGQTTAAAGFAALAATSLVAGGVISPTALAANTNDWAPTGFSTASMVRVSASAAYNLTGIAGGAAGRLIMLHNIGSFTITLKNAVTSSAANQFQLSADYSLAANQSVLLEYDGTTARWRIFGQQTAATIPSQIGLGGASRKAAMSVTTASATATFTADEIVVETALGGAVQVLASFSQSINLGTTGAGGMDTGTAPVSGFVSLYAIAKADGTKNILACNVTTSAGSIYAGANMPTGYTYSALIGIWPTNGSSQFVAGYIGGPFERKFNYQTFASIFTGTADKTSLTSQSISGAVPSVARTASVVMGESTSASNTRFAAAGDGTGTGGKQASFVASNGTSPIGGMTTSYGIATFNDIPLITAQTIYVLCISGGSTNNCYVSDYTW